MSVESEIKALKEEISGLSRKLDFFLSEKSLNEDPDYIKAISEARKGNGKALLLYSKKRFEARNRITV